MKYAVDMGSGAMIYVPNFIKTGSSIQKLIRGIHRHRQHGDLISLILLAYFCYFKTMIYIPIFIKICSGIQKLVGGIHRHTDSMEESRLK
jgi:hypothetical protein